MAHGTHGMRGGTLTGGNLPTKISSTAVLKLKPARTTMPTAPKRAGGAKNMSNGPKMGKGRR